MATTLHDQRSFLLQRAQPAMAGLIDGSLSTLAPIFAVAFATHQSHYAFLAGLATAIGAGVSMAFSEGLSDTGDVTGRGLPYLRGAITGAGTFLGGILHTLPFLIPQYRSAVLVALAVIALELLALAVIRRRFFGTSFLGSLISVTLGGAIIATISVVLGQSALCRRPRRRVSLSAARYTGVREDEMKAAVLHAIGEPLRIEEVPTPRPGPGQVLVKIAAAGVCHSDLHQQDGSVPPHRIPLIMGHENAGWVAGLGPGAEGPAEGDPVVVYGGWGCGQCRFCLGGQEQLCDGARWAGLGPDGGYAEYLLVPATRHLLPAGSLDLVKAAGLTDAGLSSYRAAKKALPYLPAGTTAVVIGAGGLGQYGVQYLKLMTSATVIALETSPVRRQLALSLGADHAIDGSAADALGQIRELSGGQGAAAVLDFVGIDATMKLGLASLTRQGVLVLVGLAGGTVPVGFFTQASEAAITTSTWGSRNDLAEVVTLAQQGKVTATTESHRLDDINHVLERLEHGLVEGRAVVVP